MLTSGDLTTCDSPRCIHYSACPPLVGILSAQCISSTGSWRPGIFRASVGSCGCARVEKCMPVCVWQQENRDNSSLVVSAPSYLQHSQKQVYELIGKCQTQSRLVKHALTFPGREEDGRIGSSKENRGNMEETIGGRGWTDTVKMRQMGRSVGRSDRTRGRDRAKIRVRKIAGRLQQGKLVTKAGLWRSTCCTCPEMCCQHWARWKWRGKWHLLHPSTRHADPSIRCESVNSSLKCRSQRAGTATVRPTYTSTAIPPGPTTKAQHTQREAHI